MNNTILKISLGAFLALSTSVSSAADLSYNYVEGGITKIDNSDVTGYGISGSYAFNNNMNLIGSYETAGDSEVINGTVVSVDVRNISAGVGYHAPISANTDMVFTGQLVSLSVDASAGNQSATADGSGYGMSAGVRSKVSNNFEVEAALNYVNIESVSDSAFSAGARYYFNKKLSVGLSTVEGDSYTASVRMDF